MDEKFLMQLFAEFKHAQGKTLGLFTQAVCQQLDPKRLKADLARTIAAEKLMHGPDSLQIGWLTEAMAAADAEAMLQSRPLSEGPHPTRKPGQ